MDRHIACLTFDFDAVSIWIQNGMVTPTPISRGEFGAIGAERILNLLNKYKIKATWFVPGHTLETYPELCQRIHREGHEIANHGYAHEVPSRLSAEQEEAVLVRASEAIKKVTGKSAMGYRSPAWDLGPRTLSLLVKHGFLYDSSMMGNDFLPYFARQGDVVTTDKPMEFGRSTRIVEMPISWSLDDFPHFEFYQSQGISLEGLRNASGVLENWVDDFRYMVQNTKWGVLTYTFHPQVIGRGHRMLMLENLIKKLSELGANFERLDVSAREWIYSLPSKFKNQTV
jgi:peptidoglycan/xylan/chitin deacetylase (PgdA/CDA1 family)